jgi:hypothetical protein
VSTHGAPQAPIPAAPPVGQPAQQPPGAGYSQPGDGTAAYGGYQQQQQQGPGMGDRAAHAAHVVGRHVKTPETKEFFKTSEFVVWGLTVLALLIAGAVIGDNGGADDNLKAGLVWTLVAATSIGYIVSRGISKAGARRGYGEAPMDQG